MQLAFPTLLVLRLDERLGLWRAWAFHILPVEMESFAGALRYATHEGKFGERTAVVEIAAGFALPFAGVDPVTVVALDAFQRFGRTGVGLHGGAGQKGSAV